MNTLKKKLKRIVNSVTDKKFLDELGKVAKNNIKDRTRQGYGVENKGDRRHTLKQLSSNYIETRRVLKKQGKLSSKTSPKGVRGKSNLTKFGEMIDSLSHEVQEAGFRVFVKGKENQQKVRHNANLGRTFLNLSDKDIKELTNLIKARISEAIRKL